MDTRLGVHTGSDKEGAHTVFLKGTLRNVRRRMPCPLCRAVRGIKVKQRGKLATDEGTGSSGKTLDYRPRDCEFDPPLT